MALPTQVSLSWSIQAVGGISMAQLGAVMNGITLYSAPPPGPLPTLPAGTSDAMFDVLFGANVISDAMSFPGGLVVRRTLTLGLSPGAGTPTAPSFVSLGGNSFGAPTNNPPLPSPDFPVVPTVPAPAPANSGWTGCVVSSSPLDFFKPDPPNPPIENGAYKLRIFYIDINGVALHEDVFLNGTTPVNLVNPNKYQITNVSITGVGSTSDPAPFGQINIWSGPPGSQVGAVDPVTGLPTGKVVGYLPNSFFKNFTLQQLTKWTTSQLNPSGLGVRNTFNSPDYGQPETTVSDVTVPIPPGPSHSFLDYPPPSFQTNPATPDNLTGKPINSPLPYPNVTPYPFAPNFVTTNPYLAPAAFPAARLVPSPFNGLFVLAFAQAASVDPRLVIQIVTYS